MSPAAGQGRCEPERAPPARLSPGPTALRSTRALTRARHRCLPSGERRRAPGAGAASCPEVRQKLPAHPHSPRPSTSLSHCSARVRGSSGRDKPRLPPARERVPRWERRCRSGRAPRAPWAAGSVSQPPLRQRCLWLVQFIYVFICLLERLNFSENELAVLNVPSRCGDRDGDVGICKKTRDTQAAFHLSYS